MPSSAIADPETSSDVSRAAVVLFLSYQVPARPAFDAGALQAGCWDQVTDAVRDLGHGEVSRTELEPLMRRWGVRTALLLSDGFLKEVGAGFDVKELLVVDLMIYPGRLILCGRSVRTDTGRVVWADLEDVRLPSDLSDAEEPKLQPWLDTTRQATRRLLERWKLRTVQGDLPSDLFLVPVRTKGLEETAGDVVTYCLLRSLLGTERSGIEDPGVTFSRLRDAGIDPQRFDRRFGSILGANGMPCALLMTDLVIYGLPEDLPQDIHLDEEGAAGSIPSAPAFTLSMRLVNAESGIVRYSATEYLAVPPQRGLFGVERDVSLVQRVREVTDRLVHAAIQKG